MWFPRIVRNFTMISKRQTVRYGLLVSLLCIVASCGVDPDAQPSESAIIDPPSQCSPDRPDCSSSGDFPDASDLTPDNSAGIRYSSETGALVVDRAAVLPDSDGDGVSDDADDCPGTPDWITCDGDPTNDGLYATLFYDPTGGDEVVPWTLIPDVPASAGEYALTEEAFCGVLAEVAQAIAGLPGVSFGQYGSMAIDPARLDLNELEQVLYSSY